MKVAVNARLLGSPYMEGIGRYLVEHISRMAIAHPEDEYVLLCDKAISHPILDLPNVSTLKIGLPARTPLLWRLWFDWSVPRAIDRVKADIFFSPESYNSTRLKIPSVITTHDLAYEHDEHYNKRSHIKWLKKWMPRYHQVADAVVCVSQYTQQDVINRYQIDQSKTQVIYNGINEEYRPWPKEEIENYRKENNLDKPYFLYIGAIHPRKNIARLIRAYELLQDQSPTDHELILIGRQAWRYDDVINTMKSSKYQDRIRHLGYWPGDISGVIAGAEALVYPSMFEGFGLPILEGMNMRTPVICSDRSAMPEIAGDAAILISPDDTQDIADAMQRVISMPATDRSVMIAAGIKNAQRFSWDAASRQLYDILQKVLKEPTSPLAQSAT